MISSQLHSTDFRILLPETIWLESEHFDQARSISKRLSSNEVRQWETYLSALALLGFESWLQKQIPDQTIQRDVNQTEAFYLQVGEFKLCLLATEQILDEVVNIPKTILEQPRLAAHFYVVLEVLEEQEQAIARGFLRHDELMSYYHQADQSVPESEIYSLPLSALDAEINHLVVYARYSTPSAILQPEVSAAPDKVTSNLTTDLTTDLMADLTVVRTRLGQWLQGTLDQGWQAIDTLINPEATLALSPRQLSSGTKGGKLINFEMQLGTQTVALVVTVVPEEEEKLGIGIQVLPVGEAAVLPPQLKLTLLSKAEEVLQDVQSRGQDNYIQLRPFKGKRGTNFSIEVSLNGINVKEAFEL